MFPRVVTMGGTYNVRTPTKGGSGKKRTGTIELSGEEDRTSRNPGLLGYNRTGILTHLIVKISGRSTSRDCTCIPLSDQRD